MPRPVLYEVLINEPNLSMDTLQELTHALCHNSQRVAKPSNVPAPAFHAHLMCSVMRAFDASADPGNGFWRVQPPAQLLELPFYI